jgi:SAM-dependent methyltransferase
VTSWLRDAGGTVLDLPAHRWTAPASDLDLRLLTAVDGPALDVGCGPGRHVLALARAGVVALGIDISLPALELARDRGAPVLHRSVFARVPAAGRWRSALLLDGNVGIGGCPTTLLGRLAELLRRDGRLLVEVDPAPVPTAATWVRFESETGAGPWFRWTRVDERSLGGHAVAAGLTVVARWRDAGRCFAWLAR